MKINKFVIIYNSCNNINNNHAVSKPMRWKLGCNDLIISRSCITLSLCIAYSITTYTVLFRTTEFFKFIKFFDTASRSTKFKRNGKFHKNLSITDNVYLIERLILISLNILTDITSKLFIDIFDRIQYLVNQRFIRSM